VSGGAGPGPGLSCYTANLHGYLAREWDAAAIVARSVRLAVRVDLPGGLLAFSHHEPSLDLLPDGSRLRYAGAASPAAALPGVAAELAAHGRVLVVVDGARLPWAVTRGGRPVPHWLLVDGRRPGAWHVRDGFAALLPAGEQRPHAGWLCDAELRAAMTPPARWEPEQELRGALAFGAPVPAPAPAGGAIWLRRTRERPPPAPSPEGCWLRGYRDALPFLASYVAERAALAARHLDDVWAAAGHRSFALRWRLAREPSGRDGPVLAAAVARWERLPRLLRLAVESAARGRPRASLVRAALEELGRAEEAVS
jgi:hypothetical protein